MTDIKFRDTAHRDFFLENMMKCKVNDCYHRAFFYVMGISAETRANIGRMFNFKEDCIEPEGMRGGWQTSGTVRVCQLAFNLWNGYTEKGQERYFTPEELFCCEFAPYFMEGIKVRYPEYCRELPVPKKQTEYTGIVEKVENDIVYTVEGNSGDTCRQKQYPVGYYEILGYGIPAY